VSILTGMDTSDYTDLFTSRLTPAAQRVLDVASELFYERGIHAVGVDTIAAAAEVTKKTIYDRFRSKDNLIALYLHRRDQAYRRWMADWAVEHPRTPPILGTFDAMSAWMTRYGKRGCAFVNASGEIADPEHPARQVTREHKAWLRGHLHDLATDAGHDDPGTLAAQLLSLHEGATVLYSVGADLTAPQTSRDAAAVLLAHGGRAT